MFATAEIYGMQQSLLGMMTDENGDPYPCLEKHDLIQFGTEWQCKHCPYIEYEWIKGLKANP